MRSAYPRARPRRIVLLNPEAWAAAEELAEAAGVTPTALIEFLLLDYRDCLEPEPEPASQRGVIPISRARRRRRRPRSNRPWSI